MTGSFSSNAMGRWWDDISFTRAVGVVARPVFVLHFYILEFLLFYMGKGGWVGGSDIVTHEGLGFGPVF